MAPFSSIFRKITFFLDESPFHWVFHIVLEPSFRRRWNISFSFNRVTHFYSVTRRITYFEDTGIVIQLSISNCYFDIFWSCARILFTFAWRNKCRFRPSHDTEVLTIIVGSVVLWEKKNAGLALTIAEIWEFSNTKMLNQIQDAKLVVVFQIWARVR